MTAWRLVCDAGGTRTRIARSAGPHSVLDVQVIPTAGSISLAQTLAGFAASYSDVESFEGAAIAGAGPVQDGVVALTNADLAIDARAVSAALQRPVRVINDLEAVAWALPHLSPAELLPVIDVELPLSGPRLVVNIGTGFGAALLIDTPNGRHVLGCEPGHMTLALPWRTDVGPLSVEEVLSGLTLGNPARRSTVWGDGHDAGDLADPFAADAPGGDAQAFRQTFSALFGQVCGDLVLATGAWGGVFTCGSVANAWVKTADRDAFSIAFRSKGPMQPRMQRVQVQHIAVSHPALIGLAAAPLN